MKALLDLQSKYRLAMAAGDVHEMALVAEQIEHLRKAAMRRRSTQRMLAPVLATKGA